VIGVDPDVKMATGGRASKVARLSEIFDIFGDFGLYIPLTRDISLVQ
jgi:hypothetical protein